MPIYEFQCSQCGHALEVIQRVSDRPPKKCPECGGKLVKQHSRTAFVLKGGGWYAHGYTKGSASAKGSKEATASEGSKPADKPTKPAGGTSKAD